MTAPTGYTPSENFTQDETNRLSGRATVKPSALDAEFAAIAVSIGGLISSLTQIQRADGLLTDSLVDVFNLRSSVLALIGSAGFTVANPVTWATATVYPARQMVVNDTGTYVSAAAHTAGTFATDLVDGKWALLFDSVALVASAISFAPAGTLIATTVQAAIIEAAGEALQKADNLSDLVDAAVARTNLAVPSTGQLQAQTFTYFADTGSADALAITPAPALAAYVSGQRFAVKKGVAANATTTPTLNVNALGALTITKNGGLALLANDMLASGHYDLEYDAVVGGFELKNPAARTPSSTLVVSSTLATVAAGATNYMGSNRVSATEGDVLCYIPFACTVRNMRMNSQVVPGAGETYTYTLRKAGVDTAITGIISGALASGCSDLTHQVAVAAGQSLTVKIVASGGAGVGFHWGTFELAATA